LSINDNGFIIEKNNFVWLAAAGRQSNVMGTEVVRGPSWGIAQHLWLKSRQWTPAPVWTVSQTQWCPRSSFRDSLSLRWRQCSDQSSRISRPASVRPAPEPSSRVFGPNRQRVKLFSSATRNVIVRFLLAKSSICNCKISNNL